VRRGQGASWRVVSWLALMRQVKVDPGNPSKDAVIKVDSTIEIPEI